MNELTNDSKKLIVALYKDYLQRLKQGKSKPEAKNFGSSHYIHENLLPDWSFENVDDTCRELSRAGLIVCQWADNIACNVTLSDSGIVFMENRFKNGVLTAIDVVSNFIP